LNIAEKTVRIHVSSVLDKLNARDRTQAAIYGDFSRELCTCRAANSGWQPLFERFLFEERRAC